MKEVVGKRIKKIMAIVEIRPVRREILNEKFT